MWKIGNIEIKNQVVLAPMAGISNTAYRQIIKEMGAGLIYAEMVSDKAICYGSEKTYELLKMNESERPIAQQIFGSDLTSFVEAAKKIVPTLEVFTINSITYNTLNKLNLIDIWCDPVYEEEVKLPEINGYKGAIEGNYIKYDCANLHIQWFTLPCKL